MEEKERNGPEDIVAGIFLALGFLFAAILLTFPFYKNLFINFFIPLDIWIGEHIKYFQVIRKIGEYEVNTQIIKENVGLLQDYKWVWRKFSFVSPHNFSDIVNQYYLILHYIYLTVSFILLSPIVLLTQKKTVVKDMKIKNKWFKVYSHDKLLQTINRKITKVGSQKRLNKLDYAPPFLNYENNDNLVEFIYLSLSLSQSKMNNDITLYKKYDDLYNKIFPKLSIIDKYFVKYYSFLSLNEQEKYTSIIEEKFEIKLLVEDGEVIDEKYSIEELSRYLIIKELKNRPTFYIRYAEKIPTPKPTYDNLIPLIKEKLRKLGNENWNNISYIKSLPEYNTQLEKMSATVKNDYKFLEDKILYGYDESKKELGRICIPRYYILNPKKSNSLENFKTPGFMEYIYPVFKELIIDNYIQDQTLAIQSLVDELKNIDSLPLSDEMKDIMRMDIEQEIKSFESLLSNSNKESRMKIINDFHDIHKFEETFIIALWEYSKSLTNLPVGRLSNLKNINPVLWYALTSLGRPFTYSAGLPIITTYQMEKAESKIIERKDISKVNDVNELIVIDD